MVTDAGETTPAELPVAVVAPAPSIHSARPAPPVPLVGRLTALAVSLCCLTVLMIAATLRPSPTGVGTHTQLGLQPCQFLHTTGLPAPTCGMTTSFAWLVRGNLLASLYVQPMGTVLALLTAVAFWLGIYIAATGKPAHRLVTSILHRYTLIPLAAWAIVAWGWKIFIHTHGIDGWK